MWEAAEGQRNTSIYLSDGPHLTASIHVYGSVGSVIHRDVARWDSVEVRRSVCVVCTAACLVELDLISGPRSDPI
jgi:hypothetical protein